MQELSGVSRWYPPAIIIRFFEVFAYKTCHCTVTVLPHADKHIVASGLKPEKFKYIPNGVLENDMEVEDCGLGLPKDNFLFGHAGTIGIANKLQLLIDVAQNIEDKDILFCILWKGSYKDELMKYCKKNNVNKVTFYNPIKKHQIPHFLSQLDTCYIALQDEKTFFHTVSLQINFSTICMQKNQSFTV